MEFGIGLSPKYSLEKLGQCWDIVGVKMVKDEPPHAFNVAWCCCLQAMQAVVSQGDQNAPGIAWTLLLRHQPALRHTSDLM